MHFKTILFTFLLTANAYAFDRHGGGENSDMLLSGLPGNAPMAELDNNDYESMVTSVSANNDASAFSDDGMTNYSNDDDSDY